MDCSTTKKKKNNSVFTLKCSVMVSYLISVSSNVLLIIIHFLMEHNYKWLIFIIHSIIVILAILSFKNLIDFSGKNLVKFKALNSFYQIAFILSCITYIIIVIYLGVTKQDQDVIFYYSFCLITWGVFNGLFISVIRSFIKNMEDRPAKKSEGFLEKGLKDLIFY